MRNRRSLNNFFRHDKKTLYMILSILLVSVFTLTVVYAALSTTLNINGTAEVSSASWDIHLDNVQLNSNSTTSNVPTITDPKTATFSTTLTKPGDFYEFTIDVVNNGSIDAMIDGVTKTPELTTEQAKYLNYIVEYQNGELINTKQLVSKNSFVRLKVKVEFRKDLTASDLPTQTETLNLSFRVNYVQSDDSNEYVTIDNNGKLIKVVSGDYDTVGSEICIGKECFYVISSDEDSVTMLAKYNLYVGGFYDMLNGVLLNYGDEATGIQDETIRGWTSSGVNSRTGVTPFSSINYWSDNISSYPSYIYNEESYLYKYVENYKKYLQSIGLSIFNARLISYEEVTNLGCNYDSRTCDAAPKWLYSTSYWTGSSFASNSVLDVFNSGTIANNSYSFDQDYGVRPVIEILKREFN